MKMPQTGVAYRKLKFLPLANKKNKKYFLKIKNWGVHYFEEECEQIQKCKSAKNQ